MSNDFIKEKRSKRIHDEETSIKRQVKIAKQYGVDKKYVEQPHRFAKHHVFDCGNPGCVICSNPRHNKMSKDKLTIQEKRMFQSQLYDETNG